MTKSSCTTVYLLAPNLFQNILNQSMYARYTVQRHNSLSYSTQCCNHGNQLWTSWMVVYVWFGCWAVDSYFLLETPSLSTPWPCPLPLMPFPAFSSHTQTLCALHDLVRGCLISTMLPGFCKPPWHQYWQITAAFLKYQPNNLWDPDQTFNSPVIPRYFKINMSRSDFLVSSLFFFTITNCLYFRKCYCCI